MVGQGRSQSRTVVQVKGLPNHLSRDQIQSYFERTGSIKYVFRERVHTGNGTFSGCCRITYDEEIGAKKAVLDYNQRKFSYRHTMRVAPALCHYNTRHWAGFIRYYINGGGIITSTIASPV